MDSPVLLPVNWQMPVPSLDMLILRIAANTTSVWKVWPVNTVAQLVQFSKLAIATALVTVRIPKMFPAGKCNFVPDL